MHGEGGGGQDYNIKFCRKNKIKGTGQYNYFFFGLSIRTFKVIDMSGVNFS